MTIFGAPWEELGLEHVEAFLATAGREPLTWEAKGTQLRAEQVTKHVCGFANAADGGYLLLGFELVDGQWHATGCAFRNDDPPVWVSNVVRTTLRPRPRIDVKDWEVAGRRRAAVVRVDPVTEPPCVTTGGELYERVSGETIPVGDPADVRALYERGRAAVERAEANARRALDTVALEATLNAVIGPAFSVVLAIAPVGTTRDVAAEVFAPDAEAKLRELVDALPPEPYFPEGGWQRERSSSSTVSQDAVTVETTPELIQMWRLRTAWDGSVGGLLRARIEPGDDYILADPLFEQIVQPLAAAIETAARGIGGHGRAHVVFRPVASDFGIHQANRTRSIPAIEELRPIQRWADGEPWLDEHLLASMRRELLRACGFAEWEPAP